MEGHLITFKEVVASYLDNLPAQDWNIFQQRLTPVSYKKGETAFPATEVCKKVLFITEGIMASEYQGENETIITRFFKPNALCSNVVSAINKIVTNDRVFAITAVEGVLIPYDLFLENYLHSNQIGLYFRKWMLTNLVDVKHFVSIKTVSGVQPKLDFLQENYPEVILEAPWKYIANFMGVTPAWLSRTLKKKEFRKNSPHV